MSPQPRALALACAVLAVAFVATACCGNCGSDPDAQLPSSVPIYPKATSVSKNNILGVSLFTFNAPDKAKKVKKFYDKKLKKSFEPVESKWRTRRELAGTKFQYRRWKEVDGKAYVLIDIANNPKNSSTFTEIHYCPDGPLRCKPKS